MPVSLTTEQELEALVQVKDVLLFCASHLPDDVARKHGTKPLNISIQNIQKMISKKALEFIAEEDQRLGFYDADCGAGLSLHNIN